MINATITGSATGYIIRDNFPWASVIFISLICIAFIFIRKKNKSIKERNDGIY